MTESGIFLETVTLDATLDKDINFDFTEVIR